MSLLFMDSFDHYSSAEVGLKWSSAASSPTIQAAAGRHSSACLRLTSGVVMVTISRTPGDNTIVCGGAFKTPTIQSMEIFSVMSGATIQMSLCLKADGALEVRRDGRFGTVLGTSSATSLITANTFFFIELKALISTTVGTVSVQLNGAAVTGLTGVTGLNNAQAAVSTWDGFNLRGRTGDVDFDDVYLLDGTGAAPLQGFLGDVRVDARMPTAEGTTIGWTPLSGTDNALMVDEIPPNGDTDYNSTPTVNAIDTLVVQDAPVVGATILGVQTNIYVKKTDAGTTSIASVIRSGTDQVGTTVNPGTTYAYTMQAYGVNPATGVAWTEAGFNAAEFGYKRIA